MELACKGTSTAGVTHGNWSFPSHELCQVRHFSGMAEAEVQNFQTQYTYSMRSKCTACWFQCFISFATLGAESQFHHALNEQRSRDLSHQKIQNPCISVALSWGLCHCDYLRTLLILGIGVVTSQAFPSGLVCSHSLFLNRAGWYLAFCLCYILYMHAYYEMIFREIVQRIL